jgi:acetyltransferase-like isoleucine patch superfamily enzyme
MNSLGLGPPLQPEGAGQSHRQDAAEAAAVRVMPAQPQRQQQATGVLIGRLQRALKGPSNTLGLTAVALPAMLCGLESWFSGRDELFLLCGQALAFVPGLPGKYLRKCFYHWTLEACPLSCDIGFLSYFSDRRVRMGERVYIGSDVHIGTATLGEGTLVGSRASIINGRHQHQFGPDGRLTAFDSAAIPRVHIGDETWIGEAAILMADVGSRCVVAAGSVVSNPVPDGCIVGGNPARFVGRTTVPAEGGPCS